MAAILSVPLIACSDDDTGTVLDSPLTWPVEMAPYEGEALTTQLDVTLDTDGFVEIGGGVAIAGMGSSIDGGICVLTGRPASGMSGASCVPASIGDGAISLGVGPSDTQGDYKVFGNLPAAAVDVMIDGVTVPIVGTVFFAPPRTGVSDVTLTDSAGEPVAWE